jgi:hypothetical protein
MLTWFGSAPNPDDVINFLSTAAQADFTKTCSIFALAAFVHARQVRAEIKSQFGLLVTVLKDDLDAQKSLLAGLSTRVDKIETQLKIKE